MQVSDEARSENQDEDDSRDLTFPDDEQDGITTLHFFFFFFSPKKNLAFPVHDIDGHG
jgi:hypothetical protein